MTVNNTGYLIQRFEDETLTPLGVTAEEAMTELARERAAADPGDPVAAELADVDGELFQWLVETILDRYQHDRYFANRLRVGGRTELKAAMRDTLSRKIAQRASANIPA